jgi:hypothetical protein
MKTDFPLPAACRAALIPVELLAALIVSILMLKGLSDLPWRHWFGSPSASFAMPALIAGGLIVGMRSLLRHRYALPDEDDRFPPRSGKLFGLYLLVSLVVAFVLCVKRFADPQVLALISAPALLASVLPIAVLCLVEEVTMRFMLIGALRQLGLTPLMAVLVPALLVSALNGLGAWRQPAELAWWAVHALALGSLYTATRSLRGPVLVNTAIHVAMAQDHPCKTWITQRVVEEMQAPFQTPLLVCWILAAILLWASPTIRTHG